MGRYYPATVADLLSNSKFMLDWDDGDQEGNMHIVVWMFIFNITSNLYICTKLQKRSLKHLLNDTSFTCSNKVVF